MNLRPQILPLLFQAALLTALLLPAAADNRPPLSRPQADVYQDRWAPAPSEAHSGLHLDLTLAEALLMALENNRSLAVQRVTPDIVRSFEQEALAIFDPVLSAGASTERSDQPDITVPGGNINRTVTRSHQGSIALDTFFPTGTAVSLEGAAGRTDARLQNDTLNTSRIGVSVSQALLRGFGRDVNLALLRQARLETGISLYELQGFSEAVVAQVENAYWDYALAQRQIEIVQESLKLAEQQLADTQSMIEVGVMAESELPAVQAEVALQRQGLIDVKKNLATTRLRLLQLLNPAHERPWDIQITLIHPPAIPEVLLDAVDVYLARGVERRPEINQAKLSIAQGDLEVVRTKNGLLPRLDLFITLGKSGYADSFSGAISDLGGDSYDTRLGFNLEYPIANRGARARHQRAQLSRGQAEKALQNLTQLVELDILDAHLEVNRTREQISAGAATRAWREETVRIETEKFQVGRSTNLLVAQAQRDLLLSRIEEVRSVVGYLQALTNLYRLEGSLLERRGIQLP
jgi:outer membrane protein